jgi:hypothetical protein
MAGQVPVGAAAGWRKPTAAITSAVYVLHVSPQQCSALSRSTSYQRKLKRREKLLGLFSVAVFAVSVAEMFAVAFGLNCEANCAIRFSITAF